MADPKEQDTEPDYEDESVLNLDDDPENRDWLRKKKSPRKSRIASDGE